MIIHICQCHEWQTAVEIGEYRPNSLVAEGFIHCSQPKQILHIANRFYPGVPDLMLLWIDPQQVKAEIRWEAVLGDDFPHIYGPLNLDAVISVKEFVPDASGVYHTVPDIS
jgi:uncharacterized protein (DUF952 family)